jgi:hypothetical protein
MVILVPLQDMRRALQRNMQRTLRDGQMALHAVDNFDDGIRAEHRRKRGRCLDNAGWSGAGKRRRPQAQTSGREESLLCL